MAIYEIKASTVTSAPPEQIWTVLDDFRGWPEWMPAMKNLQVKLLTDGPLAAGYRFQLRGMLALANLEVIAFAPFERATRFRLNLPPLDGVNRCVITPLEDGRCRIDRADQLNLPGALINVIDATQRRRFEQLAREFLQALKTTAELRTANVNA